MHYAHSIDNFPKREWQGLAEHLAQVANKAGVFGARFGAEKAARLAGALHDIGKYSTAFQARLDGDKMPVDHATAGAQAVLSLKLQGYDQIVAELIAYSIAGHHAGLADRLGGDACLTERLKKNIEPLDPSWKNDVVLEAANLWTGFESDARKVAFQLAFLGRMIFSCLVDADYLDTEEFYARHEDWTPDRDWPALPQILDKLGSDFSAHMEKVYAGIKAGDLWDTLINRLRREILEHVRGRATEKPGLFTLTVPTGGGKTLASLAFALDHAKSHGLERIIYAIPFTSVVDQTASVFRDVLGGDVFLEHHSAIEDERDDSKGEDQKSGRNKLRLAMENWAAPIVVTTNAQLFESLFAARPSRCRKLHNLARSVIVLDEAQTIPLPFLRPCAAALDELARNYGASIVLCTATQPALDARHFNQSDPIGLTLEDRELAPEPRRLAQALKRVRIEIAGEMSDDALVEAMARQSQGLVIVNSRRHALDLFRKVKTAGLDGAVHLTTRQYAAHRRRILVHIRAALKEGRPCRVIATSLVEAGVDVDFPRVWRAEAGLDQIAQAAGRCNREGRRTPEDSLVTIFKAPDQPPPREIAQLAADFARMAEAHPDLLAPDALEAYFREVYWRKGDGLDREKIFDDFTMSGGKTNFGYQTVSEKFRMIESGLAPVIVAKEAAASDALAKLAWGKASAGGVARDLQRFIVQVPPRARAKLIASKAKHVSFENSKDYGDQFAVLRTDSLYTPEVGLMWDDMDYIAAENLLM